MGIRVAGSGRGRADQRLRSTVQNRRFDAIKRRPTPFAFPCVTNDPNDPSFGKALTRSLNEARTQPDGIAIWEEEDYCSPPLAEERAAVLDRYFDEISVEQVAAGEGWKRIEALPMLNRKG